MILTAHQPAYLPWLGYFHKLVLSDVYIVLDDVQFEKNSFTNRNRIYSPQGALMLTVPIQIKGHTAKPIRDIEINNIENWRTKHWKSLVQSYRKAPFFHRYASWLESIYSREWCFLIDLTTEMLQFFIKDMDIKTSIVKQSDLNVISHKQDLVFDLCQKSKSDVYISGKLGRDYLDVSRFKEAGIYVYFQDYQHPMYQQRGEIDFIPNLGIIDLLMNVGPEQAPDIIVSGNAMKNQLEKKVL
jgi:hypothetical protein